MRILMKGGLSEYESLKCAGTILLVIIESSPGECTVKVNSSGVKYGENIS